MLDNSHGNKSTFLATPEARDLDVPPRCRFGALRQELAKGAACRGSGGGPQGGLPPTGAPWVVSSQVVASWPQPSKNVRCPPLIML